MKPLASFLYVLNVLLTTACGAYNEADLEYLRDLWFDAIKKSNESLSRNGFHSAKDFQFMMDALSDVRVPSNGRNIFRDIRNVLVKNYREKTFGMFTNFCGPGSAVGTSESTVCGMFNGVDECCKAHDNCENVILPLTHYTEYQERYPNLPRKRIFFSSLSCECDVAFYNCMARTQSLFAEIVMSIYSTVQYSCFQFDYRGVCSKYDDSLIFPKRCLKYKGSKYQERAWQWFDLPYYASRKGALETNGALNGDASSASEYNFPRFIF